MKILIVNLHSALNLGDDGIMLATLTMLREVFPEADITAAANDPDSWQKYQGIEAISSLCSWVADCRMGHFRRKLYLMPIYLGLLIIAALLFRFLHKKIFFGSPQQRQLLSSYYNADLILSCGGGNFYAHHSKSPALVWALVTLAFAIGLGKRTIMLPQSIGPIEGKTQRFLTSLLLNQINQIMLRENRSVDFVRTKLRIQKECILLPDMAFGLPILSTPPHSKAKEGLQIGVTVIDRTAQNSLFEQQEAYEQAIETLLINLINELGAHINIFVQCYGPSPDQDDRIVAHRLYKRMQQYKNEITLRDSFHGVLEIREAYHSMDCLIGTRMHTAIFALGGGVPIVLIAYQPKAQGVMEFFGLKDYCCDIDGVTCNQLYQLVCDALKNRDEISQRIAEKYAKSKKQLQMLGHYLLK